MDKILKAPMKYIQGRGIIEHLSDYISQKYPQIIIIADEFVIQNMKEQLLASLKHHQVIVIEVPKVCSKDTLFKLIETYELISTALIIGVGGGKTMDVAKGLGFFLGSDVIVVPTIASTDAPCSSLAVLYHDDFTLDSYLYLKRSPSVVLVDLDVIAKAPIRLFVAGIGDALSTYIEAKACYEAHSVNEAGGRTSYSALMIAKICYESIINYALVAVSDMKKGIISEAVENMVETTIFLSGIGFESGGLSIAHTLHNALTKVESTKSAIHGEIVAYTTLVQIVCNNEDEKSFQNVYKLCKEIGLPTSLEDLGIEINEKMIEIIEEECFLKSSNIHNVPYEMDINKLEAAIHYVESYKESYVLCI